MKFLLDANLPRSTAGDCGILAGALSPGMKRRIEQPTMEADPIPLRGTDNQDDATGLIRLNALRLKVAVEVQRKK